MNQPLEDGFNDVIAKAQSGLKLSDKQLSERSGVSVETIESLKEGKVNVDALQKIAPKLNLGAESLINLASGKYRPEAIAPEGFAMFNSPYEDFTVNSYLAWDAETREAIVFDTGADATDLLARIEEEKLTVHYILLTHTHGDHILELDRVIEKTGAPAFSPEQEPLDGAAIFVHGTKYQCGKITVTSYLTNGHSPGGTTFVVEGLATKLAIVGDSLFAGSMGGAASCWDLTLTNNRDVILSLDSQTIICPGHGPLTTVELERNNNPFFPELCPR